MHLVRSRTGIDGIKRKGCDGTRGWHYRVTSDGNLRARSDSVQGMMVHVFQESIPIRTKEVISVRESRNDETVRNPSEARESLRPSAATVATGTDAVGRAGVGRCDVVERRVMMRVVTTGVVVVSVMMLLRVMIVRWM